MRKIFTFKTLLVAAGLLTGSGSAWAEAGYVTTNANIDFSNAISDGAVAGTVNSMTIDSDASNTISDGTNADLDGGGSQGAVTLPAGVLVLGKGTHSVVIPDEQLAGTRDIVTVSFEIGFSKLNSGYAAAVNFLDSDGDTIVYQEFDSYNGDFNDKNGLDLAWSEMYRGMNATLWDRRVYFTITFDYAANTINTKTTCYMSGTGKAATNRDHTVSMSNTNPIKTFRLSSNTSNKSRRSAFDNLLIKTTEGDYTIATDNYTVKYMCGTTEIKDPDTRVGDVESAISLYPTDIANFTNTAGTQRYIYVSDDAEGKTVAAGGSTVVTVTFREAEKYNYTLQSKYGETDLAFSATSFVWEDQNTVTEQYPRYQASGTTLVGKAPVSNKLQTTFTVTEDNYTTDLEYTSEGITNLYFLSEAENLGTGLNTSATSFSDRVSGEQIIYGASGTLLSLPAGKYIFTLGVIGGDTGTHRTAYTVSAGDAGQIAEGTCTGNFLTLIASDEFTLDKTTPITFTCSDPNSSRGIDLVYIQKTGDYTVELTSAANLQGYKTFYNATTSFEADENTTVYTASTPGTSTVTINPLETKIVPAGQPVVLKTTDAGYCITLTATTEDAPAGAYDSNAFQYAATDGVVSGAYILAYTTANYLGFYPFTGSLDAGDVYLTAGAGAKVLRIVFGDGTATGIDGVSGDNGNDGEAIYNVAGQQVDKDYKGIVIKGGKKYLQK